MTGKSTFPEGRKGRLHCRSNLPENETVVKEPRGKPIYPLSRPLAPEVIIEPRTLPATTCGRKNKLPSRPGIERERSIPRQLEKIYYLTSDLMPNRLDTTKYPSVERGGGGKEAESTEGQATRDLPLQIVNALPAKKTVANQHSPSKNSATSPSRASGPGPSSLSVAW